MSRQPLSKKLEGLPLIQKVGIIFACLVVIRIGSVFPLPFINQAYIDSVFGSENFNFVNAITGGSLKQMSLFALSIGPYITASIVLQLLAVLIKPLEEMQKDGKTGRDQYKRLTSLTGCGFGLLEAGAMAVGLGRQGLFHDASAKTIILAIVVWTVGSMILIAMGEFLDLLKVGSGISMILLFNILSGVPGDISSIYQVLLQGKNAAVMLTILAIVLAIAAVLIFFCTGATMTKKSVPIIYSTITRSVGTVKNEFPIPLFLCSVMPVIFASTIMSIPAILSQFVPKLQTGWFGTLSMYLNSSQWFVKETPQYTLGVFLYLLLTMMFTSFYLQISFNPAEIANNLKMGGGTIPGIRPGAPTAEMIEILSKKVAFFGNLAMVGVILLMQALCNISGMPGLSIAGTSIVICINVIMEEKNLLQAQLVMKEKYRAQRKGSYGLIRSRA